MMTIDKVIKIQEFMNDGVIYGAYSVTSNNKQYIFIRNNNSIGVINFYLGEPVTKCISEIRDDVRDSFLALLKSV